VIFFGVQKLFRFEFDFKFKFIDVCLELANVIVARSSPFVGDPELIGYCFILCSQFLYLNSKFLLIFPFCFPFILRMIFLLDII
jgi:hypothetical protein